DIDALDIVDAGILRRVRGPSALDGRPLWVDATGPDLDDPRRLARLQPFQEDEDRTLLSLDGRPGVVNRLGHDCGGHTGPLPPRETIPPSRHDSVLPARHCADKAGNGAIRDASEKN